MTNIYGTSLPCRATAKEKDSYSDNEDVPGLIDLARSGHGPPEGERFKWKITELLQAFDDSGNSPLHMVCQNAPLDTCIEMAAEFQKILYPLYSCQKPRPPRPPFQRWSPHAFLVHQNQDGNIFLHVVARSGSQSMLIMAYRFLIKDDAYETPDARDPGDRIPENVIYGYDEFDDYDTAKPLMALLTANNAGRDVAAEAPLQVTRAWHSGWTMLLAGWIQPEKGELIPVEYSCLNFW